MFKLMLESNAGTSMFKVFSSRHAWPHNFLYFIKIFIISTTTIIYKTNLFRSYTIILGQITILI